MSIEDPANARFEVGKQLIFVPDKVRHEMTVVTVTDVGRKWVSIQGPYPGMRFKLKSMRIDDSDMAPAGAVYTLESNWVATQKTWYDLQREISRRHIAPDGVTLDDIRAAAKLLGVALDEDCRDETAELADTSDSPREYRGCSTCRHDNSESFKHCSASGCFDAYDADGPGWNPGWEPQQPSDSKTEEKNDG